MDNYLNADLVVRDVNIPATTQLYPSYIVNRNGNNDEILPGHYSTPTFKQTKGVSTIYDNLHGSVDNWVINHELALKRK